MSKMYSNSNENGWADFADSFFCCVCNCQGEVFMKNNFKKIRKSGCQKYNSSDICPEKNKNVVYRCRLK